MRVLFASLIMLLFLAGCNVVVVSSHQRPYYNHQYQMQRVYYYEGHYLQRYRHSRPYHRRHRGHR